MMWEVEQTINELCRDKERFETGGKLCTVCRRYKPPPTKKCHKCQNNEFFPVYCDAGSRVCEFLVLLVSANVWPLSGQMEDSAIAFQIRSKSVKSKLKHKCDGFDRCPLSQAANTLEDKVRTSMTESEGFDLGAYQKIFDRMKEVSGCTDSDNNSM